MYTFSPLLLTDTLGGGGGAGSATERDDGGSAAGARNDSVAMISFDGRVVVRNLRSPLALATGLGAAGAHHHRGVVFTERHEV